MLPSRSRLDLRSAKVLDCDHDPMSAAGLPDVDVARAQRWCASQVPKRLRSEIRVECDIAPRHLTICECRPPWCDALGSDWPGVSPQIGEGCLCCLRLEGSDFLVLVWWQQPRGAGP